MCGIGCLLIASSCCACAEKYAPLVNRSDIENSVRNRGPNATSSTTALDDDLWLLGSVLHIQGAEIAKQPCVDTIGNTLLWNGEVFSGIDEFTVGISDTIQLSTLLKTTVNAAITQHENSGGNNTRNRDDMRILSKAVLSAVTECISHVNGPYAFIYYCKPLQLLIYGRDPLGRRSLLRLKCSTSDSDHGSRGMLAVSSVWALLCSSDSTGSISCSSSCGSSNISDEVAIWEELPVTGLFACIIREKSAILNENGDVHNSQNKEAVHTCRETESLFVPWPATRLKLSRLPSNQTTRDAFDRYKAANNGFQTSSSLLAAALLAAVRCRVASVGFRSESSAGCSTIREEGVGGLNTIESSDRKENANGRDHKDDRDVRDDRHDRNQGEVSRHCRVGVLFSGGIDSVVLAAMLHLSLDDPSEPIDLLNVAFEGAEEEEKEVDEMMNLLDSNTSNKNQKNLKNQKNQKINKNNAREKDSNSKESPAPDRLAAISALKELKEIYPTREWRLVHVDVTSNERKLHENHVKSLIRPRETHMDLNIGTALWFASRGTEHSKNFYRDPNTSMRLIFTLILTLILTHTLTLHQSPYHTHKADLLLLGRKSPKSPL